VSRAKVAGLGGALLITMAVWLSWPIHQPKSWTNADALVSDLIGVTKSNSGQVDLSKYADVVCFVAESLYAGGFARERFPSLEIVEDDKADRSEGAWFALLIFEGRKTVEIYSVDQRRLLWDVQEETPVSDAVAVMRLELLVQIGERHRSQTRSCGEADGFRDAIFQSELVEQAALIPPLPPHHRPALLCRSSISHRNHGSRAFSSPFSTASTHFCPSCVHGLRCNIYCKALPLPVSYVIPRNCRRGHAYFRGRIR
jgi:hypothetical protein